MADNWTEKLSDKAIDGVYVDSYYGTAGTEWPIGTPGMPVDNLTDAMTIADNRKTWTIRLVSPSDSWTAPDTMRFYRIIGSCRDRSISGFNLNSKNFSDTVIENCSLSGAVTTGGKFVAVNCEIDLDFTGDAWLYNCRLYDISLFSSHLYCFNCYADPSTSFILWTDGSSDYDLVNFSGLVDIPNHIAGVNGYIYALGPALIYIGGGSTGGTLYVSGIDAKIFNSGTLTLVDYTNRPNAEQGVNITAIVASETNFLNLATADSRFTIDDLVLKCVDPGANTVNVKLYKLVNGVLTNTLTFAITTVNFGTYFDINTMFGLKSLAGDNIKITVQATAGGPYAVTGSYAYRSA